MSESSKGQARSGYTLGGTLFWFGVLLGLWLLFSGHYDVPHITMGLISVGLILFINRRATSLPIARTDPTHLRILRLLLYIPWLGLEMILSAIEVARVVLHPKLPARSGLYRFRSDQPHELARVILGNSITLTPGTLTIDIKGNEFLVHALTEKTAEGLLEGTMQKKVAHLFDAENDRLVYDVRKNVLR